MRVGEVVSASGTAAGRRATGGMIAIGASLGMILDMRLKLDGQWVAENDRGAR